ARAGWLYERRRAREVRRAEKFAWDTPPPRDDRRRRRARGPLARRRRRASRPPRRPLARATDDPPVPAPLGVNLLLPAGGRDREAVGRDPRGGRRRRAARARRDRAGEGLPRAV